MKQIQVTPQFVKNFSCIAERCEDHCCHGWTINIDKPTYRFMTEKSELKQKAQQVIVKTPKVAGFAKIELNEQGVCPFRAQDGLCEVHKSHGHARLSKTCQTYPRLDVLRGNRLERNISLSCPEAVRKALFDPNAMHFDEKEVFNANAKPSHYRYPHYYSAIRQLFVEVLLAEELPLEARLYILGTAFKLLDTKKDDQEAFEQAFHYCIENITNGVFLSTYERSESMLDMHATFLFKLYNVHLALGVVSRHQQVLARIKQVHDAMLSAMSEAGEDIEAQKKLLLSGFEGHYANFFNQHSYVWINFFLYGMYSQDFPSKGLYDVFSRLVIDFFMLRGALITISCERALTTQDVVHVIQSYHRSRSHSSKIEQGISAIIENHLHIDPQVLPLLLLKVA